MIGCPRGTVWPWPSLIDPPDGWVLADSRKFGILMTVSIVATRDHEGPPRMTEEQVASIERRNFNRHLEID